MSTSNSPALSVQFLLMLSLRCVFLFGEIRLRSRSVARSPLTSRGWSLPNQTASKTLSTFSRDLPSLRDSLVPKLEPSTNDTLSNTRRLSAFTFSLPFCRAYFGGKKWESITLMPQVSVFLRLLEILTVTLGMNLMDLRSKQWDERLAEATGTLL